MPIDTTPTNMKFWILLAGCMGFACSPAWAQAQDRIYRCGNEYTNSPTQAQLKGCVALQGGNVTVVQGGRTGGAKATTAKPAAASPAATPASSQAQVDPNQQKSRDSDARAILSSELRRAEAQLADVQRDYNGGKPVARADETQNGAAYMQRVAELKASLARAQADVAGIRRELQRIGGDVPAAAGPAPSAGGAGSAVVAR